MRAHRFPLNLLVLYRPSGVSKWRRGHSENISQSGVLLRTNDPYRMHEYLELRVVLPGGLMAETPSEIFCRGKVVREVSASDDLVPGFAATIDKYELVRRNTLNAARPQRLSAS
jgi:hypothetical protein